MNKKFLLTAPSIKDHEWVDLGLPSGLKWATCNIGASSPEELGTRFAWGETEPKEDYTAQNYNTDGQLNYNAGTQLDLTDDAAHVNWGGAWRMATIEEMQELFDNTTIEVINSGSGSTHTVLKFISKINQNVLILTQCRPIPDRNFVCVGWSSTASKEEAYTFAYFFQMYRQSGPRYEGFPIRPVKP